MYGYLQMVSNKYTTSVTPTIQYERYYPTIVLYKNGKVWKDFSSDGIITDLDSTASVESNIVNFKNGKGNIQGMYTETTGYVHFTLVLPDRKLECTCKIRNAFYSASIESCDWQYEEQEVTATLYRNDKPFVGNFTCELAYVEAPDQLTVSPMYGTTDQNGQVKLNVMVANYVGGRGIFFNYGGGTAVYAGCQYNNETVYDASVSGLVTELTNSNITFTVTRNGKPYANKTVQCSYWMDVSGPSSFITDSNGQAVVTVTSSQATTGQLSVYLTMYDSYSIGYKELTLAVQPATYALGFTPANLAYNTPTNVTFTVFRNSAALANGSLSIVSWGGLSGPGGVVSTNASGQFTVTLTSTNTAAANYTVTLSDNATSRSMTCGMSRGAMPIPNTPVGDLLPYVWFGDVDPTNQPYSIVLGDCVQKINQAGVFQMDAYGCGNFSPTQVSFTVTPNNNFINLYFGFLHCTNNSIYFAQDLGRISANFALNVSDVGFISVKKNITFTINNWPSPLNAFAGWTITMNMDVHLTKTTSGGINVMTDNDAWFTIGKQ